MYINNGDVAKDSLQGPPRKQDLLFPVSIANVQQKSRPLSSVTTTSAELLPGS